MDFSVASLVLKNVAEDLTEGFLEEAKDKLSEVVRIPTKDTSSSTRRAAAQIVKGTRKVAQKDGKDQWVANHMLSKLYTQSGAKKKADAAAKKAHKDTIDATEDRETVRSMRAALPALMRKKPTEPAEEPSNTRDTMRSMKSAIPHKDRMGVPVNQDIASKVKMAPRQHLNIKDKKKTEAAELKPLAPGKKPIPTGTPRMSHDKAIDAHKKTMDWHKAMFDKYSSKPKNESDVKPIPKAVKKPKGNVTVKSNPVKTLVKLEKVESVNSKLAACKR